MIRLSVALLALVGTLAISGCGPTPKSVCEARVKATNCGKTSEEEVKKCVENMKDADDDKLKKEAKVTKCIEKSKYCEFKKDNKATESEAELNKCVNAK